MSEPMPPKLHPAGYWYTKWVDLDGEQRVKRFGNAATVSAAAAARRYRNWRCDFDASPQMQAPGRYGPNTIKAKVELYLVHAREYYRQPDAFGTGDVPTGEAEQMAAALAVLTDLMAGEDPRAFTPMDLQRCQKEMIGRGLARSTINARVNRIRRFFRWLTLNGHVKGVLEDLSAVPPVQPGRTEAREPSRVQPVHRHELDVIWAHLPPVVQRMTELEWLTGMRPGEVVVMRGSDVDRTGELWIYRPAMHKNKWRGKLRQIVLGPLAQKLIEPHMGLDLTAFLFSPRQAVLERRGKPSTRPGERYSTASYRRAIHYACDAASKAAGVPMEQWADFRWSPNQLRHAAATRLERKYGIDVARAALGHSGHQTTEGYVHPDVTRVADAMREMG